MASTVITAFNEFQRETVNLNSDDSDLARRSRDWLFERIEEFPEQHSDFPLSYEEKDIAYGSFSRRTKIRPLDDIDMISCLHATGSTYLTYQHDDVRITVPEGSRLRNYCHDSSDTLNSRKIVNRYVKALSGVSQYEKAEINRRGEAATLQLASYDWSFDIVPAFFTSPDGDGRTFNLIPNGDSHWKKADPRIDRDRVAKVNQQHDGNMLNVLRCVKYWQGRQTMPSMPSYLLECIVVGYYESRISQASKFVDIELASVFREVAAAVLGSVPDPKAIQQDINTLSWDDRVSINARALSDANEADEARQLEIAKELRRSINKWREIFGSDFPTYS